MEQLLHVDIVTLQYDLKGLRHLYDLVESNVRSVKALGVNSESYGALLSSVLVTKLPNELRLIVSRQAGEDEWNLDAILAAVETELRARECTLTCGGKSRRPREQATTAALVTTAQSCCCCHQAHSSNTCQTVTDVSSRRQLLRLAGRCFLRLRRGHLARDCRFGNKCYNCKGRHHASLCTTKTGQPAPVESERLSSSRPAPLNPEAPAYAPPNQTDTSTETSGTLWTFSNNEVLLQTAEVSLFNPNSPEDCVKALVVLDTGSQRSYLTDRMKNLLSLTPTGTQKLSIVTFGAVQQTQSKHDYVKVGIKLRSGEKMYLSMFTVPTICEPIHGQPVVHYQELYPHLNGLDLADNTEATSPREIDMLVGSDFYWDLITGHIRRGSTGPVAIHTRVGWVLSGPTCEPSVTKEKSHGLMTHALRVGAYSQSDLPLEESLRAFWELESLGISMGEKSVYDDFSSTSSLRMGDMKLHCPGSSHVQTC